MTASANGNHSNHENGNGTGDTPTGNRLTYGMLGNDPDSPLEKLEKYTGEVDWNYLRPHFKSGALVYVDPALPLTVVGHAISIDDTDQVREWRQAGDLVTPSAPHAAYWEESGARFRALVVSPFVLIQPLDPA